MKDLQNAGACNRSSFSRRSLLRGMAGAAALGAAWPVAKLASAAQQERRINQSVCSWCFGKYLSREKLSLDQFAAACAKMGLRSIEMTTPKQWPTLKKHGLICAMTNSHGLTKGLNRVENHEECLAAIRKSIDETAAAGFPNVICFSGNRDGMDDQEGLANCVVALKQIAPYAEQNKVTVCLELLNTINHKDYMASSTAWCVELVHKVGSPRVKVLYDIYHAAMMKEDPLADIQKHADCWGHFHTAGVPGRNEIDDPAQTIDYPKLMRAILDSGFSGYVAHEFTPKRPNAMESLEKAVALCDV